MTFWCSECLIFWWPYQAKEFGGACPKCGGGTRARQEPGSLDAEALFKEALAARRERDEARSREVAFEEYYAAWCHTKAIEFEVAVRQGLSQLPVAEPRRDKAA